MAPSIIDGASEQGEEKGRNVRGLKDSSARARLQQKKRSVVFNRSKNAQGKRPKKEKVFLS